MNKKYRLEYLPLFEKDISSVINYLSVKLSNPISALNLINDVEKAIRKRLSNPLGYKPFQSNHKRKLQYYRIFVKNYIVFYVVIDDVMEVRRFLYNKRNFAKLI